MSTIASIVSVMWYPKKDPAKSLMPAWPRSSWDLQVGGKRGTVSFWWSIVVILVEGLTCYTTIACFFFRRRNCGCCASSPANRYSLAVTPRYLCDPCMAQSNSWQEAIHLLSAWRHREAGIGWDYTCENQHDMGTFPFSMGNTSSVMADFPLSCWFSGVYVLITFQFAMIKHQTKIRIIHRRGEGKSRFLFAWFHDCLVRRRYYRMHPNVTAVFYLCWWYFHIFCISDIDLRLRCPGPFAPCFPNSLSASNKLLEMEPPTQQHYHVPSQCDWEDLEYFLFPLVGRF